MKKPEDLRRHLAVKVPCLGKHPENLHIFVEKGNIVSRAGASLSFEYRYQLNLIVTDFTDHADTLIIPLLAWVKVNQPDIFQHPDKQENAIRFEAEILDHQNVDLSITIDLTERVIVVKNGEIYTATHCDEPPLPDLDGTAGWKMHGNGEPVDD